MKMDCKSKILKYWYQSTGRGMRNVQPPTSDLKRKLWRLFTLVTDEVITPVSLNNAPFRNLQSSFYSGGFAKGIMLSLLTSHKPENATSLQFWE